MATRDCDYGQGTSMARIIHYRGEDGIVGYRAGDVIHDTTTDDWALVVRHGRGLALEPLRVRQGPRTGATCLGDWRLTPLDVGFDLRVVGMSTARPSEDCRSVGVDIDGEQYEIVGPRATLIAVARAAGYDVEDWP